MKACLALLLLAVFCSCTAQAATIGVRGAIDSSADESFDVYELFAVFDLPWTRRLSKSLALQPQFEVTGGMLEAAGQEGFLGTAGPRLALRTERVSVDFGVGLAVVGKKRFGNQDFGGHSQLTAQVGARVNVYRGFNLGLRFRHMSDAEIHGGRSLNLSFVEAAYRF